MAKRFGRNQRRRLREEIAQLKERYLLGCGPVQPGDFVVPDWMVTGACLDVEFGEVRRGEHHASARLRLSNLEAPALMTGLNMRGPIGLLGRRYYVRSVEVLDQNGLIYIDLRMDGIR